MTRRVIVEIRREYGNARAYPVNRDAELFAGLCDRDTLSPEAIEIIRELGFEVIETEKRKVKVP